ncbi:hypothetical protein MIMGU_mgv1a017450mg [Erythranthe guttata]|uniref:Uncharacterized protein n=1 Tax=Erythranthe guttata TaxID=4155 RepID=A0A022RRH1_ERYGU|nr:hypothetical protein MIMGU_mgv1a017450mg [Erythranthe guttata]
MNRREGIFAENHQLSPRFFDSTLFHQVVRMRWARLSIGQNSSIHNTESRLLLSSCSSLYACQWALPLKRIPIML